LKNKPNFLIKEFGVFRFEVEDDFRFVEISKATQAIPDFLHAPAKIRTVEAIHHRPFHGTNAQRGVAKQSRHIALNIIANKAIGGAFDVFLAITKRGDHGDLLVRLVGKTIVVQSGKITNDTASMNGAADFIARSIRPFGYGADRGIEAFA